MFKAHQLSGFTFKTEKTLNAYIENKGSNIYPFMYFAAFNILRGKTIHITDCPVKVVQDNKKTWGYGNDGLITEVFQNVDMLPVTISEKNKLKREFLKKNEWRYLRYIKKPIPFLKIIFNSDRYTKSIRVYIIYKLLFGNLLNLCKYSVQHTALFFGYKVQRDGIKKIKQEDIK